MVFDYKSLQVDTSKLKTNLITADVVAASSTLMYSTKNETASNISIINKALAISHEPLFV